MNPDLPEEGQSQSQSQSQGHTPADLHSLREIQTYFWPDGDDTHPTEMQTATLNASAETPQTVSHMLLFKNANPRWEREGVIFTKSNLHLLSTELDLAGGKAAADQTPESGATAHATATANANATTTANALVNDKDEDKDKDMGQDKTNADAETNVPFQPTTATTAASTNTTNQPIAVFSQGHRGGNSTSRRTFKFDGWYRIRHLTILEPRSPELVRMLEQKWSRGDNAHGNRGGRGGRGGRGARAWGQAAQAQAERAPEDWNASLSKRWAVVQLVRHEDKQRERPEIPKLEDEEGKSGKRAGEVREARGVNELLRELRFGKEKSGMEEEREGEKGKGMVDENEGEAGKEGDGT